MPDFNRGLSEREKLSNYNVQYIPRNMHTAVALLCFVVVIIDWFSHIHQAYFTGTVAI